MTDCRTCGHDHHQDVACRAALVTYEGDHAMCNCPREEDPS